MRFTATTDLPVALPDAWAALSDFGHYERIAPARRVRVARRGDGGPGTEWTLQFRLRGRERQVVTRLAALDPPAQMRFDFAGEHLEGAARLDLVALARARCRLEATVDVRPRTLAARLFLGGLRLVKPRLDRRFRKGIAQLGRSVAQRAAAPRPGA